MDQTPAPATHTDAPTPPAPPPLYNDVHFQRWEPPAPCHVIPWAPFPRLPPELRRLVWLACLRQHRMIELYICPGDDSDADVHSGGDGSRHYRDRNDLGNVVSGRDYVLTWTGRRQNPPEAYSPVLWVSREARRAALGFYRVHLPFFGLRRDRVLYLNPEYDVVSIQPRWESGDAAFNPHTLLADLLHDMKAYDRRGQGVVHLALNQGLFHFDFLIAGSLPFPLTPSDLHPTAAASLTHILQHTLRGVLFVMSFRTPYRGLGEWPAHGGYQYHFAQTLPLARREHPAGAFHWLDADPRPGVDVDVRQLPLGEDPRVIVRGWKQFEQAFCVAGSTATTATAREAVDEEGQQQQQQQSGPGPRLYICPRQSWPKYSREEMRRMERLAARFDLPRPPGAMPLLNEDEDPEPEPSPRADLARHLREEAADWDHSRAWIHETFARSFPDAVMMPRQGYVLDAETFERLERLPCTAVGLWLFPAEAFRQPTVPPRFCFDLSPVRPGLFLFEV